MSEEIKLFANPAIDSGLTVTAKVYTSLGAQQGGDVSCSEVGSLAIYLGDMPASDAGRYVVRFFSESTLLSQYEILWDGTQEIISGLTDLDGISQIEAQRIMLSALAGKVSGAGTSTERFRDLNDTKDRIVATVDVSGNRTNIVLDGA